MYTYQIILYLMMSKGPWGGRGAEFLESSGIFFLHSVLSYSYATMYNLMKATTKAETCSC